MEVKAELPKYASNPGENGQGTVRVTSHGRRKLWIGLSVVLIVIAIAAVVAAVVSGSSSGDDSNSNPDPVAPPPTLAPTLVPTDQTPTFSPTSLVRFENIQQLLLPISGQALFDNSTAQHAALT
jgi:flagellar basal body-associated protein FliL